MDYRDDDDDTVFASLIPLLFMSWFEAELKLEYSFIGMQDRWVVENMEASARVTFFTS